LVADGYRSQAELLAVPCEAVLQRAIEEGVPLIMEGVHVHPELLDRVPDKSDVIKVCVMLAVLKSKKIKARLKGRGVEAPQRKPKRYLKNLESIWSLQSFLLSEADRCNVSIVTSEEKEKAIQQITRQIIAELTRHFKGSASDVFGPVVETMAKLVDSRPWYELPGSLQDLSSQENDSSKQVEKPVLSNKSVLIIIDGLGDLPIPELDGKTPLEAADTPVLDQMASEGLYGLVDPVGPGKIPNTHSGTGMLMGLVPDQAPNLKRGPVEAFGAGCELKSGNVALRANFATIERQGDEYQVTDRRAGRITHGTIKLAASLKGIDLGDGVSASFISTDQHRGALVLEGKGLSDAISDTDPGDQAMPVTLEACQALQPEAEFTASKINLFTLKASEILDGHPVNIDRTGKGELAANGIITRGAGSYCQVDSTLGQQGVKAAVVTGCNTVKGLGRLFGFTAIKDPRFTANIDTDLDAKIEAVTSALKKHDMVFVHVKAPDICSHDIQPLAKRDFLQRLDLALEPLLDAGATIAVAADHTTDSNLGAHTADPVPALIYTPGSGSEAKKVKFGEKECRKGSMGRQLSNEFLSQVLGIMQAQTD